MMRQGRYREGASRKCRKTENFEIHGIAPQHSLRRLYGRRPETHKRRKPTSAGNPQAANPLSPSPGSTLIDLAWVAENLIPRGLAPASRVRTRNLYQSLSFSWWRVARSPMRAMDMGFSKLRRGQR